MRLKEKSVCAVILVSCGKTEVGLAISVWSRVRVYCRTPLGERGASHVARRLSALSVRLTLRTALGTVLGYYIKRIDTYVTGYLDLCYAPACLAVTKRP